MSPSGELTQVRISVPARVTSPVRRSRTEPSRQRAGTGVADTHPAAVGKGGPGVLARVENGRGAVTFGGDVTAGEGDRAALAGRAGQQHVFEGLHVQPIGHALQPRSAPGSRRASPRDRTRRSRVPASPGTPRRGPRA